MRRGRYPRIDPLGAPTKSVFLKLPVATYDELDRQSRRTGVSVPELVRRTLRPRTEYLELFRAIVLDVWRVRTTEAVALRAALEVKLAELRRREELLEEAFLYAKKIDAMTYERQRDAIREQVALATIELEDARNEEADVEGVLGFAEHVLANAARLWMEATPEQKTRLQRALFPEGLRLRDGKIGTTAMCMAFTHLREIDAVKSGVASPTGARDTYEPGHGETYELPLCGTVRKAA